MKIRTIDAEGDWQFGKGLQSYQYENNAISENIKTRLMSFLNDCWFDMNAGLDWFRLLGEKNKKSEIELTVQGIILQSYGVVRLNKIISDFDGATRNLVLQYNIDTIFSPNVENTVEVS